MKHTITVAEMIQSWSLRDAARLVVQTLESWLSTMATECFTQPYSRLAHGYTKHKEIPSDPFVPIWLVGASPIVAIIWQFSAIHGEQRMAVVDSASLVADRDRVACIWKTLNQGRSATRHCLKQGSGSRLFLLSQGKMPKGRQCCCHGFRLLPQRFTLGRQRVAETAHLL